MITLGFIDANHSREAYITWLEALDPGRFHFNVSNVWKTVNQAIRTVDNCRPQVWVIRSPSFAKPQSLRTLCGNCDDGPMPVVAICANDLNEVSTALSQQVAAVALINDPLWHLTSAIHSAAARQFFLSPQILDQFRQQVVNLITEPNCRRLQSLTEREHDVLICLAEGNSNSRIAERLHVTRATVSSHVLSILRKLDAANRTEAAAIAYRMGLVDGARLHKAHRSATTERPQWNGGAPAARPSLTGRRP